MLGFRFRPVAALWLILATGCGSGSRTDGIHAHPHVDPSPGNPVVFNLDLSTPLPLLCIQVTHEEVVRLSALYSSFLTEIGHPQRGVTLSLRFDTKGSLGSPWNLYLRNYSAPYPVRLIGILPDGKKDVIHEETF